MFTGLIEEIGTVKSRVNSGGGIELSISCSAILSDISIGDSVSINGVCQTVTAHDASQFTVFVSSVTAGITTLADLASNDPLNLERAMTAQTRMGGHIVQGHVDGTGSIVSIDRDASGLTARIAAGTDIIKYLVDRGSVAVDGISLTVVNVDEKNFVLYIIPETIDATTVRFWKKGRKVNIEVDILAKYVEKMLTGFSVPSHDERLSRKLAENGFL